MGCKKIQENKLGKNAFQELKAHLQNKWGDEYNVEFYADGNFCYCKTNYCNSGIIFRATFMVFIFAILCFVF